MLIRLKSSNVHLFLFIETEAVQSNKTFLFHLCQEYLGNHLLKDNHYH